MTVLKKGIIIAIALLAILAVVSGEHTMSFGLFNTGDQLLYNKSYVELWVYPTFIERRFSIGPLEKPIGSIWIYDNDIHGGGMASLISGGPRAKSVSIHLSAKANHSFNMTVKVYDTSSTSDGRNCYNISLDKLQN